MSSYIVNAAMREVTVLLSINGHHLFNGYAIGARLHLPSANRIGIARRDEISASRAAGERLSRNRAG